MAFFEFNTNGYIISIKATPNASCCISKGIVYDADGREFLKVMVNAVPEKGKANKELLSWLAKSLKISKNSLSIISGESDHFKKILISFNKDTELEDKLNNLAKGKSK